MSITPNARPKVTICGLGPGGVGDVTTATRELLQQPNVFLRTTQHPTAALAASAKSFDYLYDGGASLDEVYRQIADALVDEASAAGSVIYAVPGSPLVLERSVRHLRSDPRIDVELLPAISFLDVSWSRLGIDPVEEGVRLVDGHTFARDAAGERGPLLVAHAHAQWVLSDIKLSIDAGPEMTAVVLQGLGTSEERISEVPWPELDRMFEADPLTSLYLPEVTAPVAQELQRTVELMHRLRQECPWDQEQTHQSLRRHLLEETYEVIEAIDEVDEPDGYVHLEEELGDLWFQILFHAELATEAGAFSIADVARTVYDKLVSRHPHVFGSVEASDADEVASNWEAIKKEEKGRESVMDGIPAQLPALLLAEKILKKGTRASQPTDPARIAQVVSLLVATVGQNDRGQEELGRLLLAVVEQARTAGLDPETALRDAANAAADRFRAWEADQAELAADWVLG